MPQNNLPRKNDDVPPDLLNGIKAFGSISAQCHQMQISVVIGTLINAVEQGDLADFALHVSQYAIRNGLDKPIDFSDVSGV